MNKHDKTLFLYTCALDDGDFATISQIFEEASHDPVLLRKLLELDLAHQKESNNNMLSTPEQTLRFIRPSRTIYRVAILLLVLGAGILFWGNNAQDDHVQTQIINPLASMETTKTPTPGASETPTPTLEGDVVEPENTTSTPAPETTSIPDIEAVGGVISSENASLLSQFARSGAGTMNGVEWLSDNEHFALSGTVGIAIYAKSDLNTPTKFIPTEFGITVAALSPDDSIMATGSIDGVLRGIDLETGAIVYEYPLFNSPPSHYYYSYGRPDFYSIAYDATGTFVAYGNSFEGAYLVNVETGAATRVAQRPTGAVQFSPDGLFTAIGLEYSILVLETATATQRYELIHDGYETAAIEFTDDNARVYAATMDYPFIYWDLEDTEGELMPTFPIVIGGIVLDLAIFDGEVWGVYMNANGPIVRFDLEQNNMFHMPFVAGDDLYDIAHSAVMDVNQNGEVLFAVPQHLFLYDLTAQRMIASAIREEDNGFLGMTVDQAGNIIAYTTANLYIKSPDETEFTALINEPVHVIDISPVPGQNKVAVIRYDYGAGPHVEVWDTEKRQIVQTITQPSVDGQLASTKDDSFAGYIGNGRIGLYDPETKSVTQITSQFLMDFEASPTQTVIAVVPRDSLTVNIYDYAQKEFVATLHGHETSILGVSFSADGKYLASAGEAGVFVWDTATWEEVASISNAGGYLLTFSPDGKLVAVAQETAIQLVDVATSEIVHEFPAHSSVIKGLDFTPDGKYLITASSDGTVLTWGIPTE